MLDWLSVTQLLERKEDKRVCVSIYIYIHVCVCDRVLLSKKHFKHNKQLSVLLMKKLELTDHLF
jgi:hypothetical protein